MLQDGVRFLDSSSAINFIIDSGPTLPLTGNNEGELFFQTGGGGLHTFDGTAWIKVAIDPGNSFFTAPYDIAAYSPGKATANQIILRFLPTRAFSFEVNVPGSQASAGTGATATSTFLIRKNGTQVGTVTFAAGNTVGTVAVPTQTSFTPGDVLTIVAPGTVDSTLADVSFTISGIQYGIEGLGNGVATNLTSDAIITTLGYTPAELIGGKINTAQLPSLAITDTFVVGSQATMLALSTAQQGDVAIRTDLNKSYILKTNSPGTLGDWQELLTPTDVVQSVNGKVGAVTLSTTDISEGSNQYFTNARARSAISVTGTGVTYNSGTGVITINTGDFKSDGSIAMTGNLIGTGFRANQGVPSGADTSSVGYAFAGDGDTGVFSPVGAGGPANGTVSIFSNNVERIAVTPTATTFLGSAPQLTIGGTTANTISFGQGAKALPTIGIPRSNGTKIVLWDYAGDFQGTTYGDHSIGIEEYTFWFQIPGHVQDNFRFYSGTNERLRIDSSGALGLNGGNFGTAGQVLTSGGTGAPPTWTTVSGGTAIPAGEFAYGTGTSITSNSAFRYISASNSFQLVPPTQAGTPNPSLIRGASSTNATAGGLTLGAGDGGGNGAGGHVTITSGNGGPTDGAAGTITLTGGTGGNTSGAGGDVIIRGGVGSTNGRGGHVELWGGRGINGSYGNIYFHTSQTERFRINSNGAWGLNGNSTGNTGQVLTSNGSGAAPSWQNASGWNGGVVSNNITVNSGSGPQLTLGNGSGAITLTSPSSGSSQSFDIYPGTVTSAGNGSALTLRAGTANNGTGGELTIAGGTGGGGNVGGRVRIEAGTGGGGGGEIWFLTNSSTRFAINRFGALAAGDSSSFGSTGQVLTSNGTNAAPTWQAPPASEGSATSSAGYIPVVTGVPTNTPTAKAGFAPIAVDSDGSQLYVYIAGAWRGIPFPTPAPAPPPINEGGA